MRITKRNAIPGLKLVRESSVPNTMDRAVSDVPLRSPRDVALLMTPFASEATTEVFWLLPLNAQHKLATPGPIVITRGIVNASLVHPREVFRAAIVANASAIIVVHNHPSGETNPSPDDRAVTNQLSEAGLLLDIPLHDHIIITDDGSYTSLAERGLL